MEQSAYIINQEREKDGGDGIPTILFESMHSGPTDLPQVKGSTTIQQWALVQRPPNL